jgi:solute carrier family 13 (sodium-dependent dicarboxylate transporter), member 2/3/5
VPATAPLASAPAPAPEAQRPASRSAWGFWAACAALVAVLLMPQPAGLSVAGQHMLAIFAFAVVVWITEAVEYAASSIMVLALIAFLLGIAPDPAHPEHIMGANAALTAALEGFTNTAVALIAAALLIATAMAVTGLDKRIALKIISLIGTSYRRILIGTMVVMAALAFLIPTASARVACAAPIILGIIAAFDIDKKSRFAATLMLAVSYLALIWAIGVGTGAAQNVYVNGLMDRTLHVRISWIEWLMVAAPYSIVMTVILYFLLMKMMRPEAETADRTGVIREALAKLGPMTPAEGRLLLFAVVLLGFWITEDKLHHFGSSAPTVAMAALLFAPGIGVITWRQAQPRIPWGILIQLGVGVGLGTALLKTGAAGWLASYVVNEFGVQQASALAILAILWLFMIVIHLGFASGAAMAATMIPVMIGVLQQAQFDATKIAGMTMLLTFTTSVGWILPVNGPQNMLALGTETFEARDFIRIGIVLTVIAYVMLLIFAATYWRWLGYV